MALTGPVPTIVRVQKNGIVVDGIDRTPGEILDISDAPLRNVRLLLEYRTLTHFEGEPVDCSTSGCGRRFADADALADHHRIDRCEPAEDAADEAEEKAKAAAAAAAAKAQAVEAAKAKAQAARDAAEAKATASAS